MPKLHFPQPEFTTHSCDLPEGTTRVGRSSRNNLVLGDPSVSADHCELVVSWNEVIVRDHGSSNGTWVAGVRVEGELPANHGDVIRFGQVKARLELVGFPADDATSMTANFGVSRAAETPPAAKPFRKVIESDASGQDTRNTTLSVPKPTPPSPPPAVATAQPSSATPAPAGHPSGRWWWRAALVAALVLAAVGLLRLFR